MAKFLLWVLLSFVVGGVSFWAIVTERLPNPLLVFVVVVVFALPPLGSFWTLYTAIRYEKEPLPMVLAAMVPYSFLWYYFERVRPGKLTRTVRRLE